MNFIAGRSVAGRFISAGPAREYTVISVIYPVIDDAFYIALYNNLGQITGYLASDIFNSPLVSVEFKLGENGCGEFKLELDRQSANLFTTNQRISIFMFGEQTPRYTGYVMQRPKPGGTAETVEVTGYGFYEKLDKVIVNMTTWTNVDIAQAVRDLIQNYVATKTGIIWNSDKVVDTGFILTGQKFVMQTAKDVLETLAEYADDYVFGVDHLKEFYFKPRVTTVDSNARLWVGQHITVFEPEEDTGDVVNFFYVKYGEEQSDGSNYYQDASGNRIPFSDAESIAKYGYREAVLTAETAITADDVIRWAAVTLASKKDAAISAKVKGCTLGVIKRNIKPEGMAVITTADGIEYKYQVTEVNYKLSGRNGVSMDMALGVKPARIDKYIKQIIKAQKASDALEELNSAT